MVPKSWNTLTLICGNHGEDYSHQMEIFEWSDSKRDAVFYRCPQYQARYGTVSGPFCNNRLTIEDYRFYKHLRGSYSEGEMIQHIESLPVSEVNFDTSTVSNACCQFLDFHSFPTVELKHMEHLNVERLELEDVPFDEIINIRHSVAQK